MALHDLQAEQGVLGAILFDNEALSRMPALEPGHFFDPVHSRIFSVIADRIRKGQLADGVTLRAWAQQQGALAEIGGERYLLTLHENAARLTAHARDYAEVIIDLAARREIGRALGEAQATLGSADTTAADIAAELEIALRSVLVSGEMGGASLREAGERLLARLDDPSARGLATGYTALDERLGGFFPGELILLAGRPSMGKTALATNLARGFARRGKRGHYASYEMGDEQIAGRSLSAAAFEDRQAVRFPYSHLRRGAAGVDRSLLKRLVAGLPDTLQIDDSSAQTLAQLDGSLRRTRRRLGGLDFVIVDYLQLMRPSGKGGTRNDQIGEVSQGLKALAKRYGVPVIALSQLSRQNEQRDDKRPMLSDLRDSGSLEQDADVVLGVYREHYYLERAQPKRESFKTDEDFNVSDWEWAAKLRKCERILEVCTLKQRNGAVGTDVLDFYPAYDVAMDEGAGR